MEEITFPESFSEQFLIAFAYLVVIYFLVVGVLHVCTLWIPTFKRNKIQQGESTQKVKLKEMVYSVINLVIFSCWITITFVLSFEGYTLIYYDFFEYELAYYLFTILLSVMIHSTYFYWTHRLLHWPFLFRFHKLHHVSHTTSYFTSYSFHPVEGFIIGGVVPLMAFVVPMHWTVIPVFLFIMTWISVYGHAGYELFGSKTYQKRFGKLFSSATHHILHHEKVSGNYGIYFTFWDNLMNTERSEFQDRFTKVTSKDKNENK